MQTKFFIGFHGLECSLTFNKGCHYIHVELNSRGVKTNGHPLKQGETIQIADSPDQLP